MEKNILFITWDGPQTSYMEGLFIPIFREVMRQVPHIQFHVLQFTWADAAKIEQVAAAAQELGVHYQAVPIMKKPLAAIGSLISLWRGTKQIRDYVKKHQIDILMPRSTFPAFMVNRLRLGDAPQIIFDADGLAIEERVDFAGLQRESQQYKWLKSIERKMLLRADAVITRSEKAINIHLANIGEAYRDKFSVVSNGRDVAQFAPDVEARRLARQELGLGEELLWIYAGSLGPQYCLEEMLHIFEQSQAMQPSKFLVLTGNTTFAQECIPTHLHNDIIIRSLPFEQIPFYMSAADAAFALRQPTYSMQGVAPIKLGEYLLMGLPSIASSGIGDTDEILQSFPECYIFDHSCAIEAQAKQINDWIRLLSNQPKDRIREKAIAYFSMEKAGESYTHAIQKLTR